MAFNPSKYDPREDSSKGHEKDGVLVIAVKTKQVGEGDKAKTVQTDAAGLLKFPKKGRFTPGGDAKLKGKLIRAHVTGTKVVHVTDGKEGKPESALAVAKRLGWDQYLIAAQEREEAKAKARKEREAERAKAKAEREAKAKAEKDAAMEKAEKESAKA